MVRAAAENKKKITERCIKLKKINVNIAFASSQMGHLLHFILFFVCFFATLYLSAVAKVKCLYSVRKWVMRLICHIRFALSDSIVFPSSPTSFVCRAIKCMEGNFVFFFSSVWFLRPYSIHTIRRSFSKFKIISNYISPTHTQCLLSTITHGYTELSFYILFVLSLRNSEAYLSRHIIIQVKIKETKLRKKKHQPNRKKKLYKI